MFLAGIPEQVSFGNVICNDEFNTSKDGRYLL